jgi:hypothetical protein
LTPPPGLGRLVEEAQDRLHRHRCDRRAGADRCAHPGHERGDDEHTPGDRDRHRDDPDDRGGRTRDAESTPAPSYSDAARSAWASDVATSASGMSDAFGDIGTKLQDSTFTSLVLLGDPDATTEMAVMLVPLTTCSDTFPAAPAADGAAQRIERRTLKACAHFESAASLLARGIDNSNTALLTRAANEMNRGIADLQLATAASEKLAR